MNPDDYYRKHLNSRRSIIRRYTELTEEERQYMLLRKLMPGADPNDPVEQYWLEWELDPTLDEIRDLPETLDCPDAELC